MPVNQQQSTGIFNLFHTLMGLEKEEEELVRALEDL